MEKYFYSLDGLKVLLKVLVHFSIDVFQNLKNTILNTTKKKQIEKS